MSNKSSKIIEMATASTSGTNGKYFLLITLHPIEITKHDKTDKIDAGRNRHITISVPPKPPETHNKML